MPADKDSANFILEIIPAFANKELTANLGVSEIHVSLLQFLLMQRIMAKLL